MADNKKLMLRAGLVLGLFSLIGIGLVSLTHTLTHEKIEENERLFVLKNLRELVPENLHDNDLLASSLQVSAPKIFANDKKTSPFIELLKINGWSLLLPHPRLQTATMVLLNCSLRLKKMVN
jgi:electron transport complex protein RnfG